MTEAPAAQAENTEFTETAETAETAETTENEETVPAAASIPVRVDGEADPVTAAAPDGATDPAAEPAAELAAEPEAADDKAKAAKPKRKAAPRKAAATKALVVLREGRVHYADTEAVVVVDLDEAANPDTDVHDVLDRLTELRDAVEGPGRAEAVRALTELIQEKALG